jgi:hypothetical protein
MSLAFLERRVPSFRHKGPKRRDKNRVLIVC